MICFDVQTLCCAQFARIVHTRKSNLSMDDRQTNFSTNWEKLDVSRRFRHINLITLSGTLLFLLLHTTSCLFLMMYVNILLKIKEFYQKFHFLGI